MKQFITLLLLILPFSAWSQADCQLFLEKSILKGKCTNSYFTDFELTLKKELPQLDSTSLFDQLPLEGKVTFNNEITLPAAFVVTERAGFSQILAKSQAGWFTFDHLKFEKNSLSFYLDHDPEVPFAQTDLAIIQKTWDLLKNPNTWHKNDDRDCEDDVKDKSYSLFCALQAASIEVEGGYNHRNAVMQLVRHQINEEYPNRKWEHRLRDFNNMPETTHKKIAKFLKKAKKTIRKALKEKKT